MTRSKLLIAVAVLVIVVPCLYVGNQWRMATTLAKFGAVASATKGWCAPEEIEFLDRDDAWSVLENAAGPVPQPNCAREGATFIVYQLTEAGEADKIRGAVESGALGARMGGLMLASSLLQDPDEDALAVLTGMLDAGETKAALALNALPLVTGHQLATSVGAGVSLLPAGTADEELQDVFGADRETLTTKWRRWLASAPTSSLAELQKTQVQESLDRLQGQGDESGRELAEELLHAMGEPRTFSRDRDDHPLSERVAEWSAKASRGVDPRAVLVAHDWH